MKHRTPRTFPKQCILKNEATRHFEKKESILLLSVSPQRYDQRRIASVADAQNA
jgi:hypothetical protein